MSRISPVRPVRSLRQSREAVALAQARTCYDHLAGRAGVALLDALLEARILAGVGNGGTDAGRGTGTDGTGTDLAAEYEVTQTGTGALAGFGVDVSAVETVDGAGSRGPAWTGRSAARTCRGRSARPSPPA